MDEQDSIEREIREKWESSRSNYELSDTEYDRWVDLNVKRELGQYQKSRVREELSNYLAARYRLTPEEMAALQEILEREAREPEIHQFLEAYPMFLTHALGGGQGRLQISKPKFADKLIPDFAIADLSSYGVSWWLVEIKTAHTPFERQDGRFTDQLNGAIDQIRECREWLADNKPLARQPEEENGLGLVGIDHEAPGLILIGRRHQYSSRYNRLRKNLLDRERIVIHSYDWLLDSARSAVGGSLDDELRGQHSF